MSDLGTLPDVARLRLLDSITDATGPLEPATSWNNPLAQGRQLASKGDVALNANIYKPQSTSPSSEQDSGATAKEEPALTSIDYLHKHAKLLGRYPKIALFAEDDSDVECHVDDSYPETTAMDLDPPHDEQEMLGGEEQLSVSANALLQVEEAAPTLEKCSGDKDATASVQKKARETIIKHEIEKTPTPVIGSVSLESLTIQPWARKYVKFESASDVDMRDETPSSPGSEYRESSFSPSLPSASAVVNSCSTGSCPPTPKRKFETDEELMAGAKEASKSQSNGKPYKEFRDTSGSLLYQCRMCPSFRTRALGDMGRHLESLVHQPPSYRCKVPGCSKVFTRKDALIRHGRKVHVKAMKSSMKKRAESEDWD